MLTLQIFVFYVISIYFTVLQLILYIVLRITLLGFSKKCHNAKYKNSPAETPSV